MKGSALRRRVKASWPGAAGGVLVLGLAGGCNRAGDLEVHDSEGQTFRVHQEGVTVSSIERIGGPGTAPKKFLLRFESRVVGACEATETGALESTADCRALVCSEDADCPKAPGADKVTCHRGLCTVPAHALDASDAVVLCLFSTGTGHDLPAQVERFAMAQGCGHPCQVPTACRQP